MPSTEVAVVGGGIAGSALAIQLARGGVAVTVLEQTEAYVDRVRGENMPPWGYLELERTGLVEAFLAGDGHIAPRLLPYGDAMSVEVAESRAFDTRAVVPDAPGMLNLSHPATCQALLDAAAAAGADVVRGVRRAAVTAGRQPAVTWTDSGGEHALAARLVVGADGRNSVVRRQVGLQLARTGPRSFAAGLLVDDLDWPADANAVGTCEDVVYLVFPRRDGRARIYLLWDRAQPSRFAGEGSGQRILDRLATLTCFPDPSVFRRARPHPGVASYPMEDTWIDAPYVEGAVLIGDAAGYNDPIIGQGLSIAVRDSRLVAEALLASRHWGPGVFEPYARERVERMRRLRATAETMTRLRVDFTPQGRRRREVVAERWAVDPTARLPIAAALVGPEALPAEAFTREAADRMLALA